MILIFFGFSTQYFKKYKCNENTGINISKY